MSTPGADPAAYRPRGRGPGPGLFALFGLGCAVLGALLALGAARLIAARPQAVLAPETAASAASPPGPALASVGQVPAVSPPPPLDGGQLDALATRVTALEQRSGHASDAAASALAAAALVDATQQSGPFVLELNAVRSAMPPGPELAALTAIAETGAPTRAALAESFPDYAARAASASRAPGDGAGLGDRVAYVLSRIVTLRRVAETGGNSTDALLARAERRLEDGDLNGALRTLDGLPPRTREALAPWRLRAERRAEVDRAAAGLRARALQELTGTAAMTAGRGG